MLEDMFGLVITPLVDICVSKPTYRTNAPGLLSFTMCNSDFLPIVKFIALEAFQPTTFSSDLILGLS